MGSGLALALASVVLAPALEELLFRGFLLPCLAARMPLPAAVRSRALLAASTTHARAFSSVWAERNHAGAGTRGGRPSDGRSPCSKCYAGGDGVSLP